MKLEKRKEKLQKLIIKIEGGKDIALRELKSVLTDGEYLLFEDMWESEQNKRNIQKPAEIKHYELLLKKADFAHSKSDSYSSKVGTSKKVKRDVMYKLETYREVALLHAVEYLETIKICNLAIWMDRNIHYNDMNTPNSASELPRVVTSRGYFVESHGFKSTYTKREIKTQILKSALDLIENPLPLISEEDLLKDSAERLAKLRITRTKPKSNHGIKV